uniref:Zinc transporter n=2 Tax=Oryza sativa TaxID=4530 RepID=Q6YZC4_ORYSJ|nr:putative zinc transporter [Oryza sativa Japonica Group]BAD13156.1 putative zinc transporter [Oryza sativa Japonica Group]
MARTMTMRVSSLLVAVLLLAALSFQACSGHGGINDGDGQVDAPATPASSSGVWSKGLIAVKVWCLVILLVFTFAGGVSPLLLPFAAGVFLGTALMHFLADSTSTFKGLTTNQYPFSFMLTCVGFLLTMLSDLVIAAVARRSAAAGVSDNQVSEQQQRQQAEGAVMSRKEEEAAAVAHPAMLVQIAFEILQETRFEPRNIANPPVDLLSSKQMGTAPIVAIQSSAQLRTTEAEIDETTACRHRRSRTPCCSSSRSVSTPSLKGSPLVSQASKSEAWRNLWTIGLHKIFAAVAMGIALLRMIPKRPFLMTVVYSLAFAVSSPVGVGIGIAIDATSQGRAADWTYAISMGLATGVFIYVAINHLIAKGYRPHHPTAADKPLFKFLAVLLGVAVMAVVMIWD